MNKFKEIINKIYKVITYYNIYIWVLVVALFFLAILGICKVFVREKVAYPKYVAVTGDSYAGFLIDSEDLRNYGMVGYAVAGKTLGENYNRMKEAMHQNLDIVIISIGANDIIKNTHPEEFQRLYHSLLLEGARYGKTIIAHSYMDIGLKGLNSMWKSANYDAVIRKEAYEFDNFHYIDMCAYQGEEFLQKDKIHYNKLFYDIFYDKMKAVIDKKYVDDVNKSRELKLEDTYMLFMAIYALLLAVLLYKLDKAIKINKSNNTINNNGDSIIDSK